MFKKQPLLILSLILLVSGCNSKLSEPASGGSGTGGGSPVSVPTVTLQSLLGGQVLKGGATADLRFVVVDALGFNSNKIEYSSDGGSTWNLATSAVGDDPERFPSISEEEIGYSWRTPLESDCSASAATTDGRYYRVRVTSSGRPDAPTDSASSTGDITVDSCPPSFSASGLSHDAASGQKTGFIKFTFAEVTDKWGVGKVSGICMKLIKSVPSESDDCWISVQALSSAGASSTLSNLSVYYFAGFSDISSTFYFWVKDEAGNISENSETDGLDTITVTRDCTAAPEKCGSVTLSPVLTTAHDVTADATLFKPGNAPSDAKNNALDPQFFVVTSKGVLIQRTTANTLALYDLIGRTSITTIANGASVVDGTGGDIRVKRPFRLALDSDENLLVFDDVYIRKLFLNESPLRMQTIVGGTPGGGGAVTSGSNTEDTLTDGRQLAITFSSNLHYYGTFVSLPNNWIVFNSEDPVTALGDSSTGYRLRIYDPASGAVSSVRFSGVGSFSDSSLDLSVTKPMAPVHVVYDTLNRRISQYWIRLCKPGTGSNCELHSGTFESSGAVVASQSSMVPWPNVWGHTLVLSAKSGSVFSISAYEGQVLRYNSTLRTWDPIAGAGPRRLDGEPMCAADSNALNCQLWLKDFYVGVNNTVFFVDEATVRFVEGMTGKIKDLAED